MTSMTARRAVRKLCRGNRRLQAIVCESPAIRESRYETRWFRRTPFLSRTQSDTAVSSQAENRKGQKSRVIRSQRNNL